jgi:cobalamin synthase
MKLRFFSISTRNILGNAVVGVAYIALGILKLACPKSLPELICLIVVTILTGASLVATVSNRREREDEMSRLHSGRASNLALWSTLLMVSIVCMVGICTNASIDLTAICYLITGFAMMVYGTSFALLERGTLPC